MTWIKPVVGTLMSGILVLGSISAILATIVLSGGILGDYDISAQAVPSDGTVKDEQKISDTSGNFNGGLIDSDRFGESLANIGDLNEDGVTDLAVGAVRDDDGGTDRGAVWILFMNSDGTVKDEQKISNTEGNFAGVLDDVDLFGTSPAHIGDLDEDGVTDIATGALFDDDGGTDRGAVWILFMNSDGTVKDEQKISDTEGGFDGVLADSDFFGRSVANIGDLNEDGVTDLAVGANGDDDGGTDRGAVWILFMNSDGTVKDEQKISDSEGNFEGFLRDGDGFGSSVTNMEDLDEDGTPDLSVGAQGIDGGGGVFILFMNSDGTVKDERIISEGRGNFDELLGFDKFGSAVTNLGDLDLNGVSDLAVGANGDDIAGPDRGAVWILFMKDIKCMGVPVTILGTSGADILEGTDGDDVIHGFAGNDVIEGKGGNDLICGGSGDDEITGGMGDDLIYGSGGGTQFTVLKEMIGYLVVRAKMGYLVALGTTDYLVAVTMMSYSVVKVTIDLSDVKEMTNSSEILAMTN